MTTEYLAEYYANRNEPFPYCCQKCDAEREEQKLREEDRKIAEERQQRISANLQAASIPEEYQVLLPPVPQVADWIARHADNNILLHGETGAGKSTSAGYQARMMILKGRRVKWFPLSALLDLWREARMSDNPEDTPYLFRRIESYDVVILDECDKPINTDSTHECMFRLIEDVSNGTSRAKLWMFGNFYRGAIENIFGTGDAVRRRFNENFVCAQILPDGQIKKIRL